MSENGLLDIPYILQEDASKKHAWHAEVVLTCSVSADVLSIMINVVVIKSSRIFT